MDMKPFIVKLVPKGDFEKISIEMPDWLTRFSSLISQRVGIKYDVYEMPTLSAELQELLVEQKYVHLALESDTDQHFLVPVPK